jgi:pimeloyl-ACP methyl ester carboxylesterase
MAANVAAASTAYCSERVLRCVLSLGPKRLSCQGDDDSMLGVRTLILTALTVVSQPALTVAAEAPVKYLATEAYTLRTQDGDASLPFDSSIDVKGIHPEITRAAIVFHGKGRNVKGYFEALESAAQQAGTTGSHTLLWAPQFLREEDVEAHRLPSKFLRWHSGSWSAGEPAVGPLRISTFDVMDALLRDLSNRTQFPNLTTVVLIGHSGGGQLLNRYAIVGREPALLVAAGIAVRFVIANPSSYFYFSDDRPQPDGSFAPFRSASCANFNHWRYGAIDAPPYVTDGSAAAWQQRESAYVKADVIYLLGADDTDPAQQDLDVSCAGEAEGAERLDRGKGYFRYLAARHPTDLNHQLWFVPGVAHVGSRMVESPCAIAAVFDSGVCTTQGPREVR